MWPFRRDGALRAALAAFALPALVAASVVAQTAQAPVLAAQSPVKIKILFPQVISTDDVWLAYGLYVPGRIGRYIALDGPVTRVQRFPVPRIDGQGHVVAPENSPASYEIDGLVSGKRVERFQALVWAPGCKMMYFDVPEIKADVEEHFVCAPLKAITLTGRVRGNHFEGKAATVWVSFDAGISGCFLLHTCDKGGCPLSCPGTTILDIANATIADDGSFKVELPDFTSDPLVPRSSYLGFLFSTGENPGNLVHNCLKPLSEDVRSMSGGLKIAASYPASLTFLPNEECWRW